jgi:hypothetical protein
LPIRLHPPVIACFPGLGSRNLNGSILIRFCLAGALPTVPSGNPRDRRQGSPGAKLRHNQKENLLLNRCRLQQSQIIYASFGCKRDPCPIRLSVAERRMVR